MTDTVVINEDSEGKTLEQSAVELGILDENGNEPAAENTEERPSWLPEKFSSAEDMAKAYAELEGRMGRSEGEETTSEEQEATEEQAREATEAAGVDFDALTEEYRSNDGLTNESYDKLAAAGIPREIVDQFIAGQEATVAQQRSSLMNEAGGEQAYQDMTEWASDNFSDAEIDAFNRTLESGDPSSVRMAVAGLKARFEADQSSEPRRTVSGEAATGNNAYRSIAELMTDMNNPKYHNDVAFRADVEAKLARSEIM